MCGGLTMSVSYNKLFEILKTRNISLTKLKDDIGVSTATISKLNKGDYISLQTLEKISRYLNVQIGELIEFNIKHNKSPLLKRLIVEKDNKIKGGIYHETQIIMTYNSNHIEGSKLSIEETRLIFETNSIILDSEKRLASVDDINETINHFRAIDYVLEIIFEPLTETIIKDLHLILKRNTKDEKLDWFNVGDYKKLPNIVGGRETTHPSKVQFEMENLINEYENNVSKTFADIVDFHYKFEQIHPFQDGNGRVGRLIAFKELLRYNQVPFTIDNDLKAFYYRGFKMYKEQKGYLIDTCYTGQDKYKKLLDYFKIDY